MKSILPIIAVVLFCTLPAYAIEKCRPGQPNTPDKHCVVDGDTLWLRGENIRLKDFDTPEPMTGICGGDREEALAEQASDRLVELLNSYDWTIERDGTGSYGRVLATIRIGERTLGTS